MSKYKKIAFPLILIISTALICLLNYTPNTFLTGWDTLHPELNFSLNAQRLLATWHSEQGLGAVPAHAQMADLPRIGILYLFHFFLPLNFLRYSYIFLCFTLGPLGIYFLVKFIFKKQLIAFLSALLYIFNLSTIQQFYVPFEMFPTQWAFLPWIILYSLKYLQKSNKKNLIIFSLLTFFSTPQAYAPQLWYAFFFIYLLFLLLSSLNNKKNYQKSIKLLLFTLAINAFWLLPNLFYIFTSSSTPKDNRNNRLYSQEYLLKNRQNGNIADLSVIKGFYFDWSVLNFGSNTFENLMPQWNSHIEKTSVLIIGYFIFIISISGFLLSVIKKDKKILPFSPFLIIPFILLGNQIPGLREFFDILIKNSTIKESFRFIFTKLSILYLFALIIFFANFLNFIFIKKRQKLNIFISLFISISLIFYALPAFQGYLISPKVRIKIPNQYFQIWDFMAKQPDGRVLSLPINQSSGWQYYKWGYQGSGFLWFNLKQNLLDRDSDRWSDKNEQAYKEFFNSLYGKNFTSFYQTLKKYQITYIIWDQNIVSYSPKNNDQVTFFNETSQLLSQLEKQSLIKQIATFDSLHVYQINDLFNSTIKNINSFIQPPYRWGTIDFQNKQDYITSDNQSSSYLPFRDLLDDKQQLDLNKIVINSLSENEWQIGLKNNNHLSYKIPLITSSENILIAATYLIKDANSFFLKFEFPLPTELNNSITQTFPLPKNLDEIKINDVVFSLDKKNLSQKSYLGLVTVYLNSQNYLNDQPINLNFNQKQNLLLKDLTLNSHSYNYFEKKDFNTINENKNYTLELPKLPHSSAYILAIKNTYFSGLPLRVCFRNIYSFLCTTEDQLAENKDSSWNYFLIPPSGNNFGYQLSLTSISIGNQSSKSSVENIAIIPLPYNFLSNITSDTPSSKVQKIVFLNEAYHKNWLAFYFENKVPIFLKKHILVNNWSNGWEVDSDFNSQVYFFFWPQMFEYLGLFLNLTLFIYFANLFIRGKIKK